MENKSSHKLNLENSSLYLENISNLFKGRYVKQIHAYHSRWAITFQGSGIEHKDSGLVLYDFIDFRMEPIPSKLINSAYQSENPMKKSDTLIFHNIGWGYDLYANDESIAWLDIEFLCKKTLEILKLECAWGLSDKYEPKASVIYSVKTEDSQNFRPNFRWKVILNGKKETPAQA